MKSKVFRGMHNRQARSEWKHPGASPIPVVLSSAYWGFGIAWECLELSATHGGCRCREFGMLSSIPHSIFDISAKQESVR
jgi:hypothetical protein